VLLAEGELADGPDLGVGLEGLLDLGRQGTRLQSDDFGGGIRVVGDGRTTVGAEEAVHIIAGATLASPLLDRAVDGQLILEDDCNQGCLE
jgi:hypothetical protein